MSDVFVSYARSTAKQAKQVAEALRADGYSVWIDDDLPAHRTYSRVIEEQMTAAKSVVVIWSAEAVESDWVQSEADRARTDHKLVQLTLDGAALPMPFDRIQCAELIDWTGDLAAPGWRKVIASVADLVECAPGPSSEVAGTGSGAASVEARQLGRPGIAASVAFVTIVLCMTARRAWWLTAGSRPPSHTP